MEITETMGKRICRKRKALGLTQDQLAERMGVSPQAVSKWENDLSCPDVTLLPKLSALFGITTDQLLGVTPEEPDEEKTGSHLHAEEQDDEPVGLHFQWNDDDGNQAVDLRLGPQKAGAVSFALWMVSMGAMLLAAHFLDRPLGLWTALWTTGLAALGLNCLMRRVRWFGLTALVGGGYLALCAVGVLPSLLTWDIVLPGLLILWGLSLLTEALFRKKKTKQYGGSRLATVKNGQLNYRHRFGDDHYAVHVREFKGGQVQVSFGDHSLDLTGCETFAPNCRLDLAFRMGDFTLTVPRRVRVERSGDQTMGQVLQTGHPAPDAQPLTLYADMHMGDLKIIYL